jgi:hypothetical protein
MVSVSTALSPTVTLSGLSEAVKVPAGSPRGVHAIRSARKSNRHRGITALPRGVRISDDRNRCMNRSVQFCLPDSARQVSLRGRHNGQVVPGICSDEKIEKRVGKSGLDVQAAAMAAPQLPEIKSLLATVELPELGPGPRAGVRPAAELNEAIGKILPDSTFSSRANESIRAVILLWHDHLEEAHAIAQSIEDRDGSFIHAMMHRRQPDYTNANYWFRHTGAHPCFPEIARRASALLEAEGEKVLREEIIPRGEWDAFAFVDACAKAERKPVMDRQVRLLREIQKIETEVLLEYLLQVGTT